MRSPLYSGLMVAVLPLVASCALFRPMPEPSLSGVALPSPPVATVPRAEVSAPEPASRLGLAGAQAMLLLGRAWPVEPLLAEVVERARTEGHRALEARALTLQAVLAWERDDAVGAVALLGAASTADPLGSVGRSARLTAEMIGRLGDQAGEMGRMRADLSAARTGLQASEGQARALEIEVNALHRQLDELKQLHIQIESEKQDDPS